LSPSSTFRASPFLRWRRQVLIGEGDQRIII